MNREKIEVAVSWIKAKAAEVWASPAGRHAVFFAAGFLVAKIL